MSDSPLKIRITDDMKASMRAGEKERLATIRLILAAIKQREVDERIDLDDSMVIAVLDKMSKQRRESIDQFGKAGRTDLVDKENGELTIIQSYMPKQLSDAEIDGMIAEAIKSTGASSVKDMGKVMGILKPKLAGRADMGKVGASIKSKLGG
ncbi:MAG TPA: GatB/YqeY domain-containing protein [Gammaproteobacteria bacterium]|nr:GatB/YqeY domain-containing protein [Gammaproteobacteria bacterium]